MPEIFSLDVEEMRENERPIKAQDSDIVEENVAVETMTGEIDPKLSRIEGPWLVGDDVAAVEKGREIIGKLPK